MFRIAPIPFSAKAISSLTLLIVYSLFLVSCSRSYTTPRSEEIKDAKGKGVSVASTEEEQARFMAYQQKHEDRLIDFLKSRSGENRDVNYIIGGGDTLEINVFDIEELNTAEVVNRSGHIALPLIGAVEAQGKSVGELEQSISSRLATYVREPQVSVFVADYGSQLVSVMGAVERPGTYPLNKGSNSIIELVGRAGGMTPDAGNIITFIPAESTGLNRESTPLAKARLSLASFGDDPIDTSGIEVPLERVLGTDGRMPIDIPVKGGDMLVVAKSGTVTVDGEVEKRGSYELGGRMTLLGALGAAGGITYAAKVDEVEVIRDIGEQDRVRLVVDLEKFARGEARDLRLRDGDIVRVPTASGKHFTQSTFEAISRLVNFGVGGNVNLSN